MKNSYISIDLEMTGLHPVRDAIIEIGAIKVQDGRITKQYETIVKAHQEIPERIIELTGITPDENAKGNNLQDSLQIVHDLFMGSDPMNDSMNDPLPLLGHHVILDYSFLKQKGAVIPNMGIDTLEIAKICLPELENKSLEFLCTYFGIPVGHHRALGDAIATHELYQRMKQEFGESHEKIFEARQLSYKVKKQRKASAGQIIYLNDLLKYHKISIDVDTESLTESEASRMIDKLRLTYGAIGFQR